MARQAIVLPLWQVAPPRNGSYPRSAVVPELPTFEEFFESSFGRKPSGMPYEAMRVITDAQTAMFRTFFMPPGTAGRRGHHARRTGGPLEERAVHQRLRQGRQIRAGTRQGGRRRRDHGKAGQGQPELKAFLKDYGDNLLKR